MIPWQEPPRHLHVIEIYCLPLCAIKKIIERVRIKGIPIISAVGHTSTAQVLSQLLCIPVSASRTMITLTHETLLIVFQLLTRLPEGKILTETEVKQLVEQGKAAFYVVKYHFASPEIEELLKAILPC